MARMALFRMVKGCDPKQYAVLDIHVPGAARFQASHQFKRPSARRPAREAAHVALLFFIVVQHDDTGDYGSGWQGGIYGRAVLNRLRYGHPPARGLALTLICRIGDA